MNQTYLHITSQDVKSFFKRHNTSVHVSTVPSKKPHKLIQAWGTIPLEVRKEIIFAVYGSLDDVADQVNFHYGNIQSQYVWMYQANWEKIFQHFKKVAI